MIQVTHHGISSVVVERTYTHSHHGRFRIVAEVARKLINLGCVPIPQSAPPELRRPGLVAHFEDFDLRLKRSSAGDPILETRVHAPALKKTGTSAWDAAVSVESALIDGVHQLSGMLLEPGPARAVQLDLYAEVAGWHVGLGTIDRFLDNHPGVHDVRFDRSGVYQFRVEELLASRASIQDDVADGPPATLPWNRDDLPDSTNWQIQFLLDVGDRLLDRLPDLDAIWRACIRRMTLPGGDAPTQSPDPVWEALGALHFDQRWPAGTFVKAELEGALPETPEQAPAAAPHAIPEPF